MTYNLKFHQKALKEWQKLDKSIRGNGRFFGIFEDIKLNLSKDNK